MSGDKIVQVRMKRQTLSEVEKLQENLNAPSRSDTIRRAVELSHAMAKAVKHGDKIIIESEDGKKTRIIIPGVAAGD